MEIGELLRELRSQKGLGLKRVAPELGITYTYLSKLESSQVRPSAELIERMASYFGYDRDLLLLAADRVPPDILEILREHPQDAIEYLRSTFGQPPNDGRT